MHDSPERIYPLVKIVTGDHLLLANDRRTLWGVRRHEAEEVDAALARAGRKVRHLRVIEGMAA